LSGIVVSRSLHSLNLLVEVRSAQFVRNTLQPFHTQGATDRHDSSLMICETIAAKVEDQPLEIEPRIRPGFLMHLFVRRDLVEISQDRLDHVQEFARIRRGTEIERLVILLNEGAPLPTDGGVVFLVTINFGRVKSFPNIAQDVIGDELVAETGPCLQADDFVSCQLNS
jgi:hypothetical protein